jgi:hypothetical protein
MRIREKIQVRWWMTLALSSFSLASLAQSAFTYQGRLLSAGQPANGVYDFQFLLSDSTTGGNQVGVGLVRPGVSVSNGLFMTTLDFGSDVFNGSNRWLEISVRTNGSGAGYEKLSPRQSVTAAPSAVFANRAATAGWASNLFSGASIGGNGAGITNLNGANINSGTITSNQLASGLDAAYRATDTNAVRAVGDVRWATKTVTNVKDYGAAGNGQGDDTAAISNAWAHFADEGGTLYFPPGTYLDSATHITSGWRTGEPPYRDGRLIFGQGSVVWRYTGTTTQFVLSNSVPDIEGIEFVNNGGGITCMYIAGPWSKWSMRNCFFNGWMNANSGTLVLDDADSATLSAVQFYQCSMGVGLGFHCGNFKGDLLFSHCGTCVAVGVPTPTYPYSQRDSKVINLSLLTAYCGTAVAVDGASGPITIQANNWYASNAVLLGAIPGISTNFLGYVGAVTIEHSWFNNGSTITPPVQLYAPVYPALQIRQSSFEMSGSQVALVKSWNSAADSTRIDWSDSVVWGAAKGMFEDSAGGALAESANDQSRFFNKGLGIYSARSLLNEGGTGYLLDVLDASFSGPVARFGLNAHTNNRFDEFWGGLTVGYNPVLRQPSVQVTNADLVVTPPQTVLGPNDPGQAGTIRWDTNYVYVCVRSNLWKRAALSSW